MPFRCDDDYATQIQSLWRGSLTRWRRRYPFMYFPPRPLSPGSNRYALPSYRNNPWIYWDRQQYLEMDCGLETEEGDCVRRGTKHSLQVRQTYQFDEVGEPTEFYCDWCCKDITFPLRDWCVDTFTCSTCDFDVCTECMEYATANEQQCDLWRFITVS